MTANFKLKPIALAMIPILFAGGTNLSLAQDSEADAKKKKEEEKAKVEVIEVTGYRGSIQRAINAKRLADGVQDSIFSEDIGKSTDQNIADALSRVTGVTVQEADGAGTRISVRGAGANLNQISLNGVALTSSLTGSGGGSGQSDQSVDLSTFSSDILSSINVIKTSAADHDEGSLGANVILRTVKPLLVDKDKRTLEVQGRYNDYAEKDNYKVSGTFSEKFFDETFGIIVTAAKETQDSRQDNLGGSWLAPYKVVDVRAGGATSLQTGLPTTEAQKAFIADGRNFSTDVNKRELETITTGMQWLVGDGTDIQLDLSYSKQEYNSDQHKISISNPNLNNKGNNFNDPDYGTDPQEDWWTIDEESRTLVKSLNRQGSGSLTRSLGGNQTETKVATLKINHNITDDLTVELTAGWSKTDFESLPNATVSTATWKTTNAGNAVKPIPVEYVEPVGYDCTSGKCILVTGETPFIFVPQGNSNGNDNIAFSGFNPYDPHSNHLNYVSRYNEQSDDENKSLFLDFDYAIEFMGVTSVEFGAKVSNRKKVVYTDRQQFQGASDKVFDEDGNVISAKQASDIKLVDVLSGYGLPVNNFADDLAATNTGYNVDYLNGWGILDPFKAFEEIFELPDIEIRHNNLGDREIEQDNVSAYTKLNFEYFDGTLTGNIGLRYVKTENKSSGYSSMTFTNQHGVTTPYDLIYKYQLWNTNLIQDNSCPAHIQAGANDALLGLAWKEPTACYDPNLTFTGGVWSDSGRFGATYEADGTISDPFGIYTPNLVDKTSSWWNNWRINDHSTSAQYKDDAVLAGFIQFEDEYNERKVKGYGSGESELWLPSLNLNWAVSDEFIIRFATSKTMARPQFDSLKPGFQANEDVWTDGANRITKTNPDLKPLESKNIDLSFEWYFNKSGSLSLAYFRKDMSNFEESVKAPLYAKDLRREYHLEELNWEDFRINKGVDTTVVNPNDPTGETFLTINSVTPLNSGCLPIRKVQGGFTEAFEVGCREFVGDIRRNGAGTLTEGVEFGYTQSYDFLPGFLSGLGTNFNYTYSDSESDAEYDEDLDLTLKALPQAYTPIHSMNTSIYWEQDGHQLRLTHQYSSDQLVNRQAFTGATWQDSKSKLDFSGTYKWDENITFTFHALNLTDETTTTYWTSTTTDLGDRDAEGNVIPFDEGNALEDNVDESRIVGSYKTGRQYRLSARINF